MSDHHPIDHPDPRERIHFRTQTFFWIGIVLIIIGVIITVETVADLPENLPWYLTGVAAAVVGLVFLATAAILDTQERSATVGVDHGDQLRSLPASIAEALEEYKRDLRAAVAETVKAELEQARAAMAETIKAEVGEVRSHFLRMEERLASLDERFQQAEKHLHHRVNKIIATNQEQTTVVREAIGGVAKRRIGNGRITDGTPPEGTPAAR